MVLYNSLIYIYMYIHPHLKQLEQVLYNLVFSFNTCYFHSMFPIVNIALLLQPYSDEHKIFLILNKESKKISSCLKAHQILDKMCFKLRCIM